MYGINLSIGEQITLVLVLMVTSKGIAGVPGVSFVVLLATLGTVGIPVEGLAFIAGIDRILDMARTAVNVVGNTLSALVMAKWKNVSMLISIMITLRTIKNKMNKTSHASISSCDVFFYLTTFAK